MDYTTWFQCSICKFTSQHDSIIQHHLAWYHAIVIESGRINHPNIEITYNCNLCEFKSVYLDLILGHWILAHPIENPEEIGFSSGFLSS